MKTRTVCIALAVIMLLALTACTGGNNNGDGTVADSTTASADNPVSASLGIVSGGVSGYTICRSDKLQSGNAVIKACQELREAIQNKTGASVPLASDWLKPGETAPELEILVGNNEREETESVTAGLKSSNFAIKIIGKKLVIAGGSEDATVDAVRYFIRNVIDKLPQDGKELTVTSASDYVYNCDYRIKSLTLLGVPVSEYSIVIPKNYLISEYRTAVFLQKHLEENCGTKPEIVYDTEKPEHEILIGATARSEAAPTGQTFSVRASGGAFRLAASSMFAYIEMQSYLIGVLFDPSVKEIAIDDGFSYSLDVSQTLKNGSENVLTHSGEVRVMFNNIYGNCQTEHPRPQRQQQLFELYSAYLPDVIGLQECNPDSRGGTRGIDTLLKSAGYKEAEYSATNYTPLFYRDEVLTLVESKYQQYSDGKGDKSKSFTWGVFEVKATGERFAVLSTHFWWKSNDDTDNAARLKDADQMMAAVKYIEEKYSVAVICGGDFNCNKTSAPYSKIKTAGFADASYTAAKTESVKSHHSYPAYNSQLRIYEAPVMPNSDLDKSIDHILVSGADKLEIKLYDVVTDLYSLLSSDHCPIYIDVNIK